MFASVALIGACCWCLATAVRDHSVALPVMLLVPPLLGGGIGAIRGRLLRGFVWGTMASAVLLVLAAAIFPLGGRLH